MNKRRRRRNGKEFSNSIQQNKKREGNPNTMEGNKNKVSLITREQKKDTRKFKGHF